MNKFEQAVAGYIGADKLEKIQSVKVGIAGAGGLGSNCACNLVRSGFKNLTIVDFDVIESSNLDRQFYFLDQIGMPKIEVLKNNLLRINPDLELNMIQQQITRENADNFFSGCDIIVEAFDKVAGKTMLVEKYYASDKFLVSASGLAGWGNSDAIVVKKIHEKFYLIGDSISEANEYRPPISPRVNIAAAKQADVILDYVINF
jgi:sulfur carrier protein ThiS adenylyltransferase